MKKLLFTLLLILPFLGLKADILEPVKWSWEKSEIGENEYELIFSTSIDDHWHLYSQYVPEDGPRKTSFIFYDLEGIEFLNSNIKIEEIESWENEGDIDYLILFDEQEPIEEFDPQFNMILKFFGNQAEFKTGIKVITSDPLTLKGYLEYMCCDDTQCLPPSYVDFEFYFNGAVAENTANNSDKADDNSITFNKIDASSEKTTFKILKNKDVLKNANIDDFSSKSLWELFFFAFLAGLAAILTPCVFPMIPMTVSFFLKEKGARAKIQASFFGFSIIAIYTIVGTIIAVTLGVNFANWLSTHWLPNVLFFLIFVIFAASFFGMFEITLPSWMISKSDKQADKGGLTGAFFMAFTLVLVSFSCTGPLVGAILVKAATGAWIEPIVGMLGFSLAFAIPFTIFAFFPSMMNKLPKSGGWLNSVKVILGFIELALGLKFLSIADQTYHWGILDREVYLALWIIIFALMGFYLLGKIKFSHDSDVKYIGVPRLMMVIITFSFVLYLLPGMWGAPLKALSGYLPPIATHDFDLDAISRNNSLAAANIDLEEGLCEKPKYSEFLHLPHGIHGYFDYEEGLACAKKQGKPVYVDFTGHGCVNCREMEANVWSDPRVLKRLKNDYIVISLYVDDKTKVPEEDWVKSLVDGKMKKTIGQIYADMQIYNFNINAQPYYVLMNHEGNLVEKPRAYDLDVDAFVEFLDIGLENFHNSEHL